MPTRPILLLIAWKKCSDLATPRLYHHIRHQAKPIQCEPCPSFDRAPAASHVAVARRSATKRSPSAAAADAIDSNAPGPPRSPSPPRAERVLAIRKRRLSNIVPSIVHSSPTPSPSRPSPPRNLPNCLNLAQPPSRPPPIHHPQFSPRPTQIPETPLPLRYLLSKRTSRQNPTMTTPHSPSPSTTAFLSIPRPSPSLPTYHFSHPLATTPLTFSAITWLGPQIAWATALPT